MYKFIETTLEKSEARFNEYIRGLTGVRDDFWEEQIINSKIYDILLDGELIGLAGIQGECITFFQIPLRYTKQAKAAFACLLSELKPTHAFVPTNDGAFLSLLMDRHTEIEMQAYFFEHSGEPVRSPEFPRELLKSATREDVKDILDEGAEANIDKYFVMRKDGVFLGQGFFRESLRFMENTACIGMSVHPDHRQKGVGRSIIMHLTDICKEKGLTPICGCWYYNHNSKKTLESAGFVSSTRLLKVWIGEQVEIPQGL